MYYGYGKRCWASGYKFAVLALSFVGSGLLFCWTQCGKNNRHSASRARRKAYIRYDTGSMEKVLSFSLFLYDCDWITQLQEILTIYPKRRCVVVSQINSSTYEIILGRFGRRIHIAKSTIPVVVGAKMFAVHSNEHGSPFWTIKDH